VTKKTTETKMTSIYFRYSFHSISLSEDVLLI